MATTQQKQTVISSLFKLHNIPSVIEAVKQHRITSLIGDEEYYMNMVDIEDICYQAELAASIAFSSCSSLA